MAKINDMGRHIQILSVSYNPLKAESLQLKAKSEVKFYGV